MLMTSFPSWIGLGYHEPPLYIRPVAETQGAAMLEAGQYEAAEKAYQEALAERPNSGFALYGLALVAEKSGDQASAPPTPLGEATVPIEVS